MVGTSARAAPKADLRFACACTLPLLIIGFTVWAEKMYMHASETHDAAQTGEARFLAMRLRSAANRATMNSTCPRELLYPSSSSSSSSSSSLLTTQSSSSSAALPLVPRLLSQSSSQPFSRSPPPSAVPRRTDAASAIPTLLIGAGFAASGLAALPTLLHRLPNACKPARASVGFWSELLRDGETQRIVGSDAHGQTAAQTNTKADTVARAQDHLQSQTQGDVQAQGQALVSSLSLSSAPLALPHACASTRERYLREIVKIMQPDGTRRCSIAWEISEQYASVAVGRRAICVPALIRYHFPEAKLLFLIGDPVARALTQQALWRNGECRAKHTGKRLLSSSSKAGSKTLSCAAAGAQTQLSSELRCFRQCRLQPDSAFADLLECCSRCQKALHAELKCTGSKCPPLVIPNSLYSIFLPLWQSAFSCDRLLLMRRDDLFGKDLRSGHHPHATHPTHPGKAATAEGLNKLLRFIGAPLNASDVASLQRTRAPAEAAPTLRGNAITPQLLAGLVAYFSPFQEELSTLVEEHARCEKRERETRLNAKRFPTKTGKLAIRSKDAPRSPVAL